MSEHPIERPIKSVIIRPLPYEVYGTEADIACVGYDGVTRIEATTKSGLHADVPYLRVWKGDVASAEYCQHNVIGITFDETQA